MRIDRVFITLIGALAAVCAVASPAFSKTEKNAFGALELRDLMKSKNILSVEQLIPELPEEYRKNFVLMHTSRSLQGASRENPRAILFGNTGRFVMTFNGLTDQKGGRVIETMELVEDGPVARTVFREIDFEQGRPRFSKVNPEKCLQCHGADPKPIWGDYDHKGGFYGPVVQPFQLSSSDGAVNGSDFLDFKKLAANHPRYRNLIWDKLNPHSPFQATLDGKAEDGKISLLPNARFSVLMSIAHARQRASAFWQNPFFAALPMTFLTTQQCTVERPVAEGMLTVFKQIAEKLHSDRPPLKFDTIAQAQRKKSISEYIQIVGQDHRLQVAFDPPAVRQFMGVAKDDLSLEIPYGSEKTKSESGIFIDTKVLFFNELVVQGWQSGRLPVKRISGYSRANYPEFFDDTEFMNYLKSTDVIGEPGSKMFSCDTLQTEAYKEMGRYIDVKKASRDFLNAKERSPADPVDEDSDASSGTSSGTKVARENSSKKLLVARLADEQGKLDGLSLLKANGCVNCHDPQGLYDIGPRIPFLDVVKFRARLLDKSSGDLAASIRLRVSENMPLSHRMPMGRPKLSDDEVKTLSEYLDQLMR